MLLRPAGLDRRLPRSRSRGLLRPVARMPTRWVIHEMHSDDSLISLEHVIPPEAGRSTPEDQAPTRA